MSLRLPITLDRATILPAHLSSWPSIAFEGASAVWLSAGQVLTRKQDWIEYRKQLDRILIIDKKE